MSGQPKNDADYASGNDSPTFVSPDQLPSSLVSSNRDTAGIPPPPNLNEPRKNNVILSFRKGSCESPDSNVGVATDCNELQLEFPDMIDDPLEGCKKFFCDSPSFPSFASENSNGEKPNVVAKRNFQSIATMDVGRSSSASAPLVSPTPKKARYGSSSWDPAAISDRMRNNESTILIHFDWRNVKKQNVDRFSSEMAPLVSPPPMIAPQGSNSCDPEIPQDISKREYVTELRENDFFCGRGGGTISRPGNKLVHRKKMSFCYQHQQAGDIFEKDRIAQSFINYMHEEHGTRFLDKCEITEQWYIIDNKRTSKIIKAILRTA